MADEVTRLITSIEITGSRFHDTELDKNIGKIREYGAVSSATFSQSGAAAAAIAPQMSSAAAAIGNVEQAMGRAGSTATAAGNQISTGIGGGAQAASSSLSALGNTASSAGQAVASSTAQAAQSVSGLASTAQSAGQTIATAGAAGASGIAPIGPAAASAGQGVAGLGGAAGQAGQGLSSMGANAGAAATGLGTVNTAGMSAKESLAVLSTQFKSNESAIISLGSQMATNRTQMAGLSSEMLTLAQSGQKNSTQFADLRNQYQTLGAQTRVLTAEQGTYRAANAAVAQSIEATSEKTGILTKLFGAKTNMVATAGTAFMGYDRILQTFLGSMGGVTLGTSLLITAVGFGIQKLLHHKSSAEEVVKANDDLIRSNAVLGQTYIALGQAQTDATNGGEIRLRAAAQQQVAEGDLASIIAGLTVNIGKQDEAQRDMNVAQQALQENLRRTSEEIFVHDTRTANLKDAQELLKTQTEGLVQIFGEKTIAFSKSREETQKSQISLEQYADANRKTVNDVLAFANSVNTASRTLGVIVDSLDRATRSQLAYNSALAAQKLPGFDTMATLDGLNKAHKDLFGNLQGVEKQYKDTLGAEGAHRESVLANKAALDSVNKKEQERILLLGQMTGGLRSDQQAHAQLEKQLRSTVAANQSMVDITQIETRTTAQAQLEALKLADGHKKVASSAGSARSAVSQYKDGVEGLSQAIDLVTKSLASGSFDKLFEDVPKKARAGVADLKKAAEEVAKSFTDLLKLRTDEGLFRINDEPIKITIAGLKVLGVEGVRHLKNVDLAVKGTREQLDLLRISSLNLTKPTIQIAEAQGKFFDSTGKLTKAARDLIAANEKLGVKTEFLLPGIQKVSFAQDELTKHVDEGGEAILDWAHNFDNGWKQAAAAAQRSAPGLKLSLKEIKDAIESSFAFDDVKIANEAAQAVESVIKEFEERGVRLGETSDQINERVLKGLKDVFGPQWTGEFKRIGDQTVKQWADDLNKLPGVMDHVTNKMLDSLGILDVRSRTKIKGTVAGIISIIDTMPGPIGESLRKSENEFLKWATFIDNVIKTIQVSLGKEQTGLAGVIAIAAKEISGIFKKSNDEIQGAVGSTQDEIQKTAKAASEGLGEISAGLKQSGDSANETANEWVAAIAKVTGAIATFVGTRGQGRPTGALGGFGAGAAIGSFFPGFGTLIGGGIGALIGGLFGTGKDKEAEKAAQQSAQDQLKISAQNVAQSLEATKQSIAKTASDILSLGDQISRSAHIPKDVVRQFAKDVGFILHQLAKEINRHVADATPELKAASEAFQSVVGLAAISPAAFDAINRSVPVAQSSVDTWVSNINRLWDGFGVAVEGVTKKERKHAEKFAKSFSEVVNIVSPSIAGMNDFFKVKQVNESDVAVWVANITVIDKGLATAADSLDKYGVKQAAHLAESSGSILDFVVKLAESQSKIVNIQMPVESDYANLFEGARVAFTLSIAFAKELNTEGLALGAEVSKLGTEVFGGLTAEIDFVTKALELKQADFSTIPDTIRMLLSATQLAVQLSAEAARTMGQEMIDEASKYAVGAKEVVVLFGETAKSFGDASITRDIYPATIQNIAGGIEMAIHGIAGIRQRVGDQMLKEAEGAATAINASLSVISNAGAAFKDLGIDDSGKAPIFSIERIDNLLNVSEYAINRVVQLAKSVNPADRAAAIAFSGDTHTISTNMSDGLGFIKAVGDQTPLSVSSFDVMVNNVANFDTALGQAYDHMLHARDQSVEFLALSLETKDNTLAGIMNLASALSAATAGSFGAASFGAQSLAGSFTSQSITPSVPIAPTAPIAPVAPSGARGQQSAPIVIQVNVQSALATKGEITEAVIVAVEELRARGVNI